MVRSILILIFFSIISTSVFSQKKAYDKGKRRQADSEVFQHWSRSYFRPQWYYKIFHSRYRRGEDRRYMWQTASNLGVSIIQKNSAEKEKELVKEAHQEEVYKDLDNLTNLKYDLLYKDDFTEIYNQLHTSKITFKILEVKKLYGTAINFEHFSNINAFTNRKDNIKNSYRPSAEKNESYRILLDDMRKYYKSILKIEKKLDISIKYYKYTRDASINVSN